MLVIGNKLKYVLAGCAVLLLGCAEKNLVPLNLPTLSGERVQIPDVQGRLTWVNTWSSSCAICVKELPDLQTLQQEYAERLQVVAIALPADPPNTLLDVQTQLHLTLPVALDLEGQAASQFAPDWVVPRHHLLDANGQLLYQATGKLTLAEMRTMLEQHIPLH
jgi:thiol-disulfide isomerase/thioredoxin